MNVLGDDRPSKRLLFVSRHVAESLIMISMAGHCSTYRRTIEIGSDNGMSWITTSCHNLRPQFVTRLKACLTGFVVAGFASKTEANLLVAWRDVQKDASVRLGVVTQDSSEEQLDRDPVGEELPSNNQRASSKAGASPTMSAFRGEWQVLVLRPDLLTYAGQGQAGAQRALWPEAAWFMRSAAHSVEREGVLVDLDYQFCVQAAEDGVFHGCSVW